VGVVTITAARRPRIRRTSAVAGLAALTATAAVALAGGAVNASAGASPAVRATAVRATAVRASAVRAVAVARPAASTAAPRFVRRWVRTFPGVVALSSPAPVTIGRVPSIVVGTRSGEVKAFSLKSGDTDRGWPVTTPGSVQVDGAPSIDGSLIFVPVGDAGDPTGGYLALNNNGSVRWYRQVPVTPGGSNPAGVQAGMTFGRINGVRAVVAGSLGEYMDAFTSDNGATRPGFPWFSSDTEFSTPVVTDLFSNGKDYIISGAEQTAGSSYGHTYSQGGHLRIIATTGDSGTGQPGGGVVCDYTPDQGVYSSPAVGRFLRGNAVGIVVGTSTDFAGASFTNKLIGLDASCRQQWVASLDGSTQDSPALVNALGYAGHLQVAEGTNRGNNTGTAYLIDGADGAVYWSHDVGGEIIGSITSVSLNGRYQDLLVPTTGGLYVLDGRTGHQVAVLGRGLIGLQSSPLVTDDPDGTIGITAAGYNGNGGIVVHWEIAGSSGAHVHETGAWPEFHHDPQLTGSTQAPLAKV
jgi:hypothetical protein